MASVNKTKKSIPVINEFTGSRAAKLSNKEKLRRSTCACLLNENEFYEEGVSIKRRIHDLIMETDSADVIEIMKDAKNKYHLRHTPLYMAVCLAEKGDLKADDLYDIINRCDDITETLAIYWENGKKPLSKQLMKGLGKACAKFDEYQYGKYKGVKKTISMRDAFRIVHPIPVAGKFGKTDMTLEQRNELYKKVVNNTLATPYTWETELSAGKDKNKTWTDLIESKKIGGLAMLRNISNMKKASVDKNIIKKGILNINNSMLLPLNYLKAAGMNPEFERDIETAMLNSYKNLEKLPGKTLFIVDVSGSMGSLSSDKTSERLDKACAMAILAASQCEDFELVATAGNDMTYVGAHEWIQYPESGFRLCKQIADTRNRIGGGGIFTRQVLEWCQKKFEGVKEFDRIIVFSDSQDCDLPDRTVPNPFGKYNYICDVSSSEYGVNFHGKWTAEITGFSEHFITYIAASEGVTNNFQQEE